MNVVRHTTATEYLDRAGAWLETAEAENNLILGIAISWVFTPAHLRRRGYATSCFAAMTQRMIDSGKKFRCLYVDLANSTSNRIFQKISCRPVCDVQDWIFD